MNAFVAKKELKHLEAVGPMIAEYKKESAEFFAPFIEAMELEGFYGMKAPCYNKNLVNPDTPKQCLVGSPWTMKAQVMMGGDLSDLDVTLDFPDYFHRAASIPGHFP